jgi:hypothetical protein
MMLTNDPKINDIANGNIFDKISKEKLSEMSFIEYMNLLEVGANITPPSGQSIGTTGTTGTTSSSTSGTNQNNIKSIWPGKGAPVEVGMTVGLKDTTGLPIPGEISHVDMAAKGAKVKNPKTGKEEWVNLDTLQPFMANNQQTTTQNQNQPPVQEDKDIQRIKQLAGISENCSAGATGAGAIAIAPAAMGKIKKRETTEEHKVEYTPKGPAKSIIGDTKPNQASGKLSADLAANGKKTASRSNNGFKK